MKYLLLAGYLFLVLSCTGNPRDLSNESVAEVNGIKLSSSEFAEELIFKLKSYDPVLARKDSIVQQTKKQIINSFVIRAIVESWAEKNGVQVSSNELNRAFMAVASNYPDRHAFFEILSREGLNEKLWKRRHRHTLLEKKVSETLAKKIAPPTSEEVKDYYESNKSEFVSAERIHLFQIVTRTEASARRIRNEIKKKKISFAEAAQKYSMAPESKKSGEVGWIEKGTIEVFDKAFELKRKTLSAVHQSPYGWHIFLVKDKKRSGTIGLADAKPVIVKRLMMKREQASFTDWLDNQIRLSTVKINEPMISAILVESRRKK